MPARSALYRARTRHYSSPQAELEGTSHRSPNRTELEVNWNRSGIALQLELELELELELDLYRNKTQTSHQLTPRITYLRL